MAAFPVARSYLVSGTLGLHIRPGSHSMGREDWAIVLRYADIRFGRLGPGATPAFPGADGAGAYASGGRGGLVYHVTRLDGEVNGERKVVGTLAYGLDDAHFRAGGVVQPRTIVFDVGGTIWLGRRGEHVGWDTQDPLSVGARVTIAGQTAPGGINLMGVA